MKAAMKTLLAPLFKYRLARIAIYFFLAYLLLCLLVVSPLLTWGAGKLYQQQTGRTLEYGLIRFNPFSLTITAYDLKDLNTDGSVFWSTARLTLNLSLLQTLTRFTYTLDNVSIDNLYVHPQIVKDGKWNFDDILQHQKNLALATPQTPSTTEPLPLAINKISLTSARLEFSDAQQPTIFHTQLDNIQFSLDHFSTRGNHAQTYDLRAGTTETGEIKVTGQLQPASTKGDINLTQLNLLPAWQYFKNHLNFTLEQAQLSGTGQFEVSWQDDLTWSIEQAGISLEKLKLRSGKKAVRNVELSLTTLQLKTISASSSAPLLAIADVQLDGLHLTSWNQGSETGIARAFSFKNSTPTNDDSAAWGVAINAFAINNAAIDWKAHELNNHLFKLRQLNLTANNIDTRSNTPAKLKLSSTIDEAASLSADGSIQLATLDGDFSSSLHAFPIDILKPLLAPYLHADIFTGEMATNTEWQIRNATLTQIISQGTVTNLKLGPLADAQEILTSARLNWSDAQINMSAQSIDVPLLEVSGLDTRFVITSDGKTNFQSLFPVTVATPDAAQTTPAPEEKPWSFTLHKFALEKSSFRFHDESLVPNFVAVVQNFGGTLTGLSSNNDKPAQFKFNGDVDGYAPVSLQGKTQPFLTQPQLDAQLNFENIDLGNFSGYSSTYAGWKIERGLLSANLHYRLNKGLIVGDNHIEMDQLQLGERVENKTSMDVPLRLALALITDANGVATLDINVSGNPKDPNFDLGKIIRSAFTNSINKIIKSPFKLLANLIGSKEDLGYLPFNSGSSRLLATATRKLNALHEAMLKRPELRIELRGYYDQKTDHRGIQVEHIKPILLESGLSNADIKARNERWQEVIEEHYAKLDIDQDRNLSADEKYERWLQTIAVSQEDLVNLAAARNLNAKQFLVQHLKLDSSRVLINANLDCSQAEACTRRIVKLELSDLNQTLVAP